jgi:hypothetical protein
VTKRTLKERKKKYKRNGLSLLRDLVPNVVAFFGGWILPNKEEVLLALFSGCGLVK